MAPLGPFDRDEWTERHPAPAVWATPKPHPRVLRIMLAVAITAATLVTAWATVEIAADLVRAL